MYRISNITGPVGYGETSGKIGNFTTPVKGKDSVKDIIARANAVPIMHIFKHYGLRFDPYTHKTICPFKSHKGGHEATPSFTVYTETNSYSCYGCSIGYNAVDFVVEMDKCNAEKAATKILTLFGTKVDENLLVEVVNSSERLELMMKLSNRICQFRQDYNDQHAHEYIEYICWVFDQANYLHNYDNEALFRLVEHCIQHIEIYDPKLNLILEKEYIKIYMDK